MASVMNARPKVSTWLFAGLLAGVLAGFLYTPIALWFGGAVLDLGIGGRIVFRLFGKDFERDLLVFYTGGNCVFFGLLGMLVGGIAGYWRSRPSLRFEAVPECPLCGHRWAVPTARQCPACAHPEAFALTLAGQGLTARCVKCGYDLRGAVAGVCTECGEPIVRARYVRGENSEWRRANSE